ncbi:MAG TPA: ATP-binding protein [Chloroflexi bacterium]|nr:MAG: magnesium chelatase [Chloroflexota bacterium]HDD55552.1 ATP-binding protein [Chloroflexota bacterium]
MPARVHSCAVLGLEGVLVEVEVDTTHGFGYIIVVGLPDTAVKESRERVRAAIKNIPVPFPRKSLIINLAPANVRKEGPAYDLPMAVGILITAGLIPSSAVEDLVIVGELSLDGSIRHTPGLLPMAAMAREKGFRGICVPAPDAAEAALIPDLEVLPVRSLTDLFWHLTGDQPISPYQQSSPRELPAIKAQTDFREIKGQEHVKRALEVAAAGNHNMLMNGPPGAGKTLLARSLPGIMPRMSIDEALDVTRIYSILDRLPSHTPLIQHRPFRAPHHTISHAGLVGGGTWPQPGEISLAHRGVLFLDEFPEFGRRVLEVLRQPLEDKAVTISRAQGSLTFPANFMLVAAMNPCPCGYYGDPVKTCTCSAAAITRYQKRLSGPILDRVDIQVSVPRVEFDKLTSDRLGEPSRAVRERVEKARQIQRERLAGSPRSANGDMIPHEIRQFCSLDQESLNLMRNALQQLGLSARAYHRVLKLSRTIADLAGAEDIATVHLAEALQYQPRGEL